MRNLSLSILIVLILFLFTGCSNNSSKDTYVIDNGINDVKYPVEIETTVTENENKFINTETSSEETEPVNISGLWQRKNTSIKYYFGEDTTGYKDDPAFEYAFTFNYAVEGNQLKFIHLTKDEYVNFEIDEQGQLFLYYPNNIVCLTRITDEQ